MIWVYIILGVVILWLIIAYNNLVSYKNRAKEAWSDIDVQLKRRYDLIPNLIESVKAYKIYESDLLQRLTEARTKAMNATSSEKVGAEDTLSATVKSLFAVAENYPQLKASENFSKLQDELTDTEDKIQAARRIYNGSVRDLNTKIQSFPSNIIAGLFNFKPLEFFGDVSTTEQEPVKVSF